MANQRALFITARQGGQHGSSLYMVTAHWVLRCSGNVTDWDTGLTGNEPGGRLSTTFIRKRDIVYVSGHVTQNHPAVGFSPVEGGHTGNPITAVLATGENLVFPAAAPASWISQNGVSWAAAVTEIEQAADCARQQGYEKAARHVGTKVFWKGF